MLFILCLIVLSESSLVKEARIGQSKLLQTTKPVDPISFNPLIPASRFRHHKEDSDEYADLYLNVEQLLNVNYLWAIAHPEEVNARTMSNYVYRLSSTENSIQQYSAPPQWSPPSQSPSQRWSPWHKGGLFGDKGIMGVRTQAVPNDSNGNLCFKGGKITIPVPNFKFRIVERVVGEIGRASCRERV